MMDGIFTVEYLNERLSLLKQMQEQMDSMRLFVASKYADMTAKEIQCPIQ